MPAQILTLYDEVVKIGSTGDQQKLDIDPFSIADLNTSDPALRAVLLFKVKGVQAVSLTMQFDGHPPCVNGYSLATLGISPA